MKDKNIIVDILHEIYDPDFDETMIVRESKEYPGLVQVEYDIKPDGTREQVSFTVNQAPAVAAAMLSVANEIKKRALSSLRADPTQG